MKTRDLEQTDGLVREADKFSKAFLLAGLIALFVGLVLLRQGVWVPIAVVLMYGGVALLIVCCAICTWIMIKARRTQVVDGNVDWSKLATGQLLTPKSKRIPTEPEGGHDEHTFKFTEEADGSLKMGRPSDDELYLSAFDHMPKPSTKKVGDHYEHTFDLTEEADDD